MKKDKKIKDVLDDYKKGKLLTNTAIKKIKDVTEVSLDEMENTLRMCKFSGYGDGKPRRTCTSTHGPMNCHTCRIAAEWEEAYG